MSKAISYSAISRMILEKKIDVLVNNAGIVFERKALDFTVNDFEQMYSINCKAPILLTKELNRKLTGGLVINVSSVSDRIVGEKYSLYCSSKAALNIYFDVVALEEKKIRFVNVLPSYVDTPLLRKLQQSRKFQWEITLKPEEVAEFIERIIEDKDGLSSGSKIIIVSDSFKEDLRHDENLWGYNATTKKLFKLKQ